MRDGMQRRPGAVPDGDANGSLGDGAWLDLGWGTDTDADGRPDTLLTTDGPDLLVLTDLDGDGLADRELRIGPDGAVHPGAAHLDATAWHPDDGEGPVVGHATARHGPWDALLRLGGLDP
jgi:hypothetical protein